MTARGGKQRSGIILGNKQPYKRKVERILYSYPALLAAIDNDKDFNYIMPQITGRYGDFTGGAGRVASKTEKYAIMRAEKRLKADAIKRGLASLTYLERDLIKQKYLDPAQPSDMEVGHKLAVGNSKYYKLKEQALHKMALALNII